MRIVKYFPLTDKSDKLSYYQVKQLPDSVLNYLTEYHEENMDLILEDLTSKILKGELGLGEGALMPYIKNKYGEGCSYLECSEVEQKFLKFMRDISGLQEPYQLRDYYMRYEMANYIRSEVLDKDMQLHYRLNRQLDLYSIDEFMENLILFEHTKSINPTMDFEGMRKLFVTFLDFLEGCNTR